MPHSLLTASSALWLKLSPASKALPHSLFPVQGDHCGVWQHSSCVGVNPAKGAPEHFFCEQCTLERSNPFWRCFSADRKPLLPAALLQPQHLPVRLLPPFAGSRVAYSGAAETQVRLVRSYIQCSMACRSCLPAHLLHSLCWLSFVLHHAC